MRFWERLLFYTYKERLSQNDDFIALNRHTPCQQSSLGASFIHVLCYSVLSSALPTCQHSPTSFCSLLHICEASGKTNRVRWRRELPHWPALLQETSSNSELGLKHSLIAVQTAKSLATLNMGQSRKWPKLYLLHCVLSCSLLLKESENPKAASSPARVLWLSGLPPAVNSPEL